MIHKIPLTKVRKILVAIGLALAASGAHAASIRLDPVSGTGPQGGQVTFDLVANFGSTPTNGGGVDLSWTSSVLTFQSFAFDLGFGAPLRDTLYDIIDLQSASLLSVGFGNPSGITFATDTSIGSVTFNLAGSPGSSSLITLSDSVRWSGFTEAMPLSLDQPPISVTYSSATATVSAVPVPAAVWLLGSGLVGLFGVARRSRRHA